MVESLLGRVEAALGGPADVAVAAPGRINIIGEHTDYIGGLALPAAIDRRIVVGLAAANSTTLHSLDSGASHALTRDALPTSLPTDAADWVRYMVGAIAVFVDHVAGPTASLSAVCAPFEAAVAGDVPRGAGLSSSAALTVAWMNALAAWSGHALDDHTVVALARQVEHRWLGVACGALDQTASQCGRAGHLLRVDFRTMAVRSLAVEVPHTWLVLDTGVRRGLAHSAYTDRVEAVTRGLAVVQQRYPGVGHWRDLSVDQLAAVDDAPVRARLRHGITENTRVDAMVAALSTGRLARAGALLDDSHTSLRDDYAVSSPALDAMAAAARTAPGVYGARMVGAGFGGCVLALAEPASAERAVGQILAQYRARTGRTGAGHRVQPARGAHRLR